MRLKHHAPADKTFQVLQSYRHTQDIYGAVNKFRMQLHTLDALHPLSALDNNKSEETQRDPGQARPMEL